MADNEFSIIPKVVTQLPRLKYLNFSGHKIKQLPEDINGCVILH